MAPRLLLITILFVGCRAKSLPTLSPNLTPIRDNRVAQRFTYDLLNDSSLVYRDVFNAQGNFLEHHNIEDGKSCYHNYNSRKREGSIECFENDTVLSKKSDLEFDKNFLLKSNKTVFSNNNRYNELINEHEGCLRIKRIMKSDQFEFTTKFEFNENNQIVRSLNYHDNVLQDIDSFTYGQGKLLSIENTDLLTQKLTSITNHEYYANGLLKYKFKQRFENDSSWIIQKYFYHYAFRD